jgi:hypothetical protein
MAEHAGPGTLEGAGGHGSRPDSPAPGVSQGMPASAPAAHETFHGRAVSWVAVSIIFAGFVLGGVSLIAGPFWIGFWAGVAVSVLGGIVMLAVHTMDDWY